MDSPETQKKSSFRLWLLLLAPLVALGAILAWWLWPQPDPGPPPDLSALPPQWKEVTLVDEGYMRLKPCGRGTNSFCIDSMPDGYYIEHTFSDTTRYSKVTAFHIEEQGRFLVDVEQADGEKSQYELRLVEDDMSIAAWSLDGKPVALMMAEGMYKALKKEFDECKAAAETGGWYYGNVGTLADSTLEGLLRKAVRRSNTVFLGITDSTSFRLRGEVRLQGEQLAALQVGPADPAKDGKLEVYSLLCTRRDSLWITLNMQQQGDFLAGRIDTMLKVAEDQWILMMQGEKLTEAGRLFYQYPAICKGPDRQLFRMSPQCLSTKPPGCPASFPITRLSWTMEGDALSLVQTFSTATLAADCAASEVPDSTRNWAWDAAAGQFVQR